MDISRRGFLKIFSAAPAVVLAPDIAKIWVPEQKILAQEPEEIKVIRAISANGGYIGVYSVKSNLWGMAIEGLFEDAPMYFEIGMPIIAVASNKLKRGRYLFMGNKESLKSGYDAKILLAWESGNSLMELIGKYE